LDCSSWQRKQIDGMIRTQILIWAPRPDCLLDDKDNVAENACDEVVMVAVGALCECSLHVSQQHHSDLSLKALDDAPRRFYLSNGMFQEWIMLKSVTAKVDDLVARKSYQLYEQKIHEIHAAMEALVYGAEKVSTTKLRQFQVRLNRAQQAAFTWSDTDH
jgi:hypothetical protein